MWKSTKDQTCTQCTVTKVIHFLLLMSVTSSGVERAKLNPKIHQEFFFQYKGVSLVIFTQ